MSTESDTEILARINTLILKKTKEILIHPRSDNSSAGLDAHRRRWEGVRNPDDSSVVGTRKNNDGCDGDDEEGEVRFAKTIDHTNLKPDATGEMVDALCEEARKFGFKSVCVNGIWAKRTTENLKGTGIKTCVVVGFPLGASGETVKAFETTVAVSSGGAFEIDMVLSIGHLKSNDLLAVYKDISSVVSAAASTPSPASAKVKVKVILETPLLTPHQIISGCVVSALAGADYVKTCTGFNTGSNGATAEAVNLMFRAVEGISKDDKKVLVKASGGVRSFAKCLEMIKAGASRIGTSSGVAIMEGTHRVGLGESGY